MSVLNDLEILERAVGKTFVVKILVWFSLAFLALGLAALGSLHYLSTLPKASNFFEWLGLSEPLFGPIRHFDPSITQCWFAPISIVLLFVGSWFIEVPAPIFPIKFAVRLNFFKVVFIGAFFASLIFGLFTGHWKPSLGILPFGIFFIPGYTKLLDAAVRQKQPFLSFIGALVPFLFVSFAANWALCSNGWDALWILAIDTTIFAEVALKLWPYATLLRADNSLRYVRFYRIAVARHTENISILFDLPLRPLAIQPNESTDWRVYTRSGLVMDVVVEKSFNLRPFRYPGQVRLIGTGLSGVEELKPSLLKHLKHSEVSLKSDASFSELVDALVAEKIPC